MNKVLDWLIMAWIGAAITLMIVPVLVFIIALAIADFIDSKLDLHD